MSPSASEAGSIAGRIVDATGRPPVSVTIDVVAACGGGSSCWKGRNEEPRKLSGTAAADGSFIIQLPPDWPPSEIQISASGSGRVRPADLVSGGEDLDLGLVALPPAQTLSGVVRDEAGRAIAGAHVTAFRLEGRTDFMPGGSYTDASGRYLIADAPEHVVQMSVTHPDYVSKSAPRTTDVWTLKPGGAIRGVVVDDRHQPVAGARLSASGQSAVSTVPGEFTLRGLAPGVTHVIASDGEQRVAMVDVVVVDHETVSATLILGRGASVRGAIRDASTRRPLPWTVVRLFRGSVAPVAGLGDTMAVADGSGRFHLSALEPGQYTFEVQRGGYLRSVQNRTLAASQPIDVVLLLAREGRIEGHVVDAADRPIPGARISVAESNPVQELARQLRAGSRDAAVTFSDQNGQFVLRGLWPGRALRIEASASGFVSARHDGIDLSTGGFRADVNFTLHPGATATGIVTDQTDQPLADVRVYSTRIDDSGTMPAAAGMLRARASTAVVTDGDGRFVESGLEQGRYFHSFERQGYSRGFIPATHILAGTINELPRVKLGAAAAIRGRVVDPHGQPVFDASIFAIDRNLDLAAASSDPDGHFEIGNLTEGDEVSLQVDWSDAATAHLKVRIPASDVSIQLAAGYTVRGRVYDAATSQPVPDFTVERIVRVPGTTTIRLGGTAARPFHADDGWFELRRVAGGPSILQVRSPGYLAAEILVPEVPTSGDVSVPMVRGSVVRGRVLLPGRREPVPNAAVTWHQVDADRAEVEAILSSLANVEDMAVTDGDGRFVLENVPSGTVTVIATHAEYAPTKANVIVPARDGLELIMNPGGAVSGIVVHDQGGPVAGATVALAPAGAHAGMMPPDTVTSDGDGRFRIGHLREGSYVLVARSPTGASPPYTATIGGSAEHQDIVLTLRNGTTIRGSVHGLAAAEQSNVFIMAHGDGYYDSTFTDSAGAFTLPHVPAGAVAIEATTSFRQGISAAARIDVPDDGPPTIAVAIDFNGRSTLSGAVTRAGRPAPSVVLSAAPLDPTETTRGRGESEQDGSYRIDGLNNGQYQLVVTGAFGTYRRIVDVLGWTDYDIDLPAGSISGIVSDIRSHEAVADAVVTAATGKERSLAEAARAITDATGFYALTDLDPGTYQLRTTRSGYRQEVQIVEVQHTEQHRDLELQRHSDITLHIFDSATGAPVSQASVRATAGGMFAFAEVLSLDNAGRTEMPDLAPGDYLLTVLVAGYAPRSLPIHIPAAALEVPLEAGGRVQLRLTGTRSTRVRLLDAAGIAQAVPGSDPAGWTAIAGPLSLWPNIASGSYRLESMTGGVTPVVVKSGAASIVEVK